MKGLLRHNDWRALAWLGGRPDGNAYQYAAEAGIKMGTAAGRLAALERVTFAWSRDGIYQITAAGTEALSAHKDEPPTMTVERGGSRCPCCGSIRVQHVTTRNAGEDRAPSGIPSGSVARKRECRRCHARWWTVELLLRMVESRNQPRVETAA